MNICTLVPAYKVNYLESLLLALRSQTVLPYRIIFSDDSPQGAFRHKLASFDLAPLREGLNIEIVDGPRRGAFENFRHLVKYWNCESELFHLLLDDDVIYPTFYERHRIAHASGHFSCSISARWEADESGQPLRGQPVPEVIANHEGRMLSLDAGVAFMTTVAQCRNWLGEFSNTVISRDFANLVLEPQLAAVSYAGLWDLGAFLAASVHRPLCYLQDHLGYFRKSPGQNSAQSFSPIMKAGVLGYVALAISGRKLGQLSAEQTAHCFSTISSALNYWYGDQEDLADFRALVPLLSSGGDELEVRYLQIWRTFLAKHGF